MPKYIKMFVMDSCRTAAPLQLKGEALWNYLQHAIENDEMCQRFITSGPGACRISLTSRAGLKVAGGQQTCLRHVHCVSATRVAARLCAQLRLMSVTISVVCLGGQVQTPSFLASPKACWPRWPATTLARVTATWRAAAQ